MTIQTYTKFHSTNTLKVHYKYNNVIYVVVKSIRKQVFKYIMHYPDGPEIFEFFFRYSVGILYLNASCPIKLHHLFEISFHCIIIIKKIFKSKCWNT